jgi:hypothetical protein
MDDAALSSHLNGLLAYGDSSTATGSGNSALTGIVLAGQQVLFA